MTTTKRNPPAKPAASKPAASKPRLTDEQIVELIRKHCMTASNWRDALRMFRGTGSSCAGQRFKGLFETVQAEKKPKAPAAKPKAQPKKGKPTGQKVTKTTQAGRQTVASAGDQEPVEPEKVGAAA